MALNAGTYEAQIVELLGDRGDVVRYTVADGTTISKGTLLKVTGTRTAARTPTNSILTQVPLAGIAAVDKVANDGSTTLGVYTNGIFEMRVSQNGGVNPGDYVTTSGANNQIKLAAAADVISGAVLGKVLEKGADTSEVIVLVNCR